MTSVTAERLALHEADTSKTQGRDENRPSFEPHVRHGATSPVVGRSTTDVHGSAVDPTGAPAPLVSPDRLYAVPLASMDAVFGEGATIYPQGLAVVGYLSMLPTGADIAQGSVPGSSAAGASASDVPGPLAGITVPALIPATSDTQAGPHSGAGAGEMPPPETFGDEGVDPSRAALDGAEMTRWLLRRLSLSGKGEGATLRLRDYRLDASNEQTLADRLLAIARDNDWPVARIVVNGREIWRQTGATIQQLQGGETHGG